jgi:hypothetical protein
MRRVIAGSLLGTVVMLSALTPPRAPVHAAETSQDGPFRLEWSKDGRKVNGYVYNVTSRYAAYMQLLVEGVDPSGNVVNNTKTWVRDVPPNNRAFFESSVPDAPSYRVSILSYKWIQEIASSRDRSGLR